MPGGDEMPRCRGHTVRFLGHPKIRSPPLSLHHRSKRSLAGLGLGEGGCAGADGKGRDMRRV